MPRSRKPSSIDYSGIPSLTLKSQAGLADINQIVRRGIPPAPPGQFLDLVGTGDYLSSLDTVARVSQGFTRLPAQLRDYCSNDPAQFLELLAAAEGGGASVEDLEVLDRFGFLPNNRKVSDSSPDGLSASEGTSSVEGTPAPSQSSNDDSTTT